MIASEHAEKCEAIADLEGQVKGLQHSLESKEEILALKDQKIQSLQQLHAETEQSMLKVKNEITLKFKEFLGQDDQNAAQIAAENREEKRQSILPIDELRLQLQAEKQLNLLLQSKVDDQKKSIEVLQAQLNETERQNEELKQKVEQQHETIKGFRQKNNLLVHNVTQMKN